MEIWSYTFRILQDYKLAIMQKNSKYWVYDLSEVYMDLVSITPTFMEVNCPVTLSPLNLKN